MDMPEFLSQLNFELSPKYSTQKLNGALNEFINEKQTQNWESQLFGEAERLTFSHKTEFINNPESDKKYNSNSKTIPHTSDDKTTYSNLSPFWNSIFSKVVKKKQRYQSENFWLSPTIEEKDKHTNNDFKTLEKLDIQLT